MRSWSRNRKPKPYIFQEKIKEPGNDQETPVWTMEDFKDARPASYRGRI